MNLTPSDLGQTFERQLLERRGAKSVPPSDARFRKLCLVMAATLPVELGIALYMHDPGLIIGPGLLTATMLFVPQMARSRERRLRESKLSAAELEALKKPVTHPPSLGQQVFALLLNQTLPTPTDDSLEGAYLTLAQDVLRLETSSEEAASEARSALKALGDAVGDLPAPAALPDVDIADLLADAEILLMRARRERDPVIAGSLERQAEATVRRARALTDALKLARRTGVLRQEVRAQVEALRAALPTLARTAEAASGLGAGRFTTLAEQVRGVAREAASVAAAQEELAQAVGAYPSVRVVEEAPNIQRLGR